jgi:hypothetical protein
MTSNLEERRHDTEKEASEKKPWQESLKNNFDQYLAHVDKLCTQTK